MGMQYSTRSMKQMVFDSFARSKTLSKFRGAGAKVMAAQAVAGDVAVAAAFVTSIDQASGGGVLTDRLAEVQDTAMSTATEVIHDAGVAPPGIEEALGAHARVDRPDTAEAPSKTSADEMTSIANVTQDDLEAVPPSAAGASPAAAKYEM